VPDGVLVAALMLPGVPLLVVLVVVLVVITQAVPLMTQPQDALLLSYSRPVALCAEETTK
jgi:hypothetical protein